MSVIPAETQYRVAWADLRIALPLDLSYSFVFHFGDALHAIRYIECDGKLSGNVWPACTSSMLAEDFTIPAQKNASKSVLRMRYESTKCRCLGSSSEFLRHSRIILSSNKYKPIRSVIGANLCPLVQAPLSGGRYQVCHYRTKRHC